MAQYRNTKPRVTILSNYNRHRINQSELKANTRDLSKAREKHNLQRNVVLLLIGGEIDGS